MPYPSHPLNPPERGQCSQCHTPDVELRYVVLQTPPANRYRLKTEWKVCSEVCVAGMQERLRRSAKRVK